MTRTPTSQQIQNDARTRSSYAFDSITLTPWLIANLGIRYDSFKTTLTPAIAAPATSAQRFSRTDDLVNWQAGLVRSEEHTSELQSLMRISYADFCLKKKKKMIHSKDTKSATRNATHEI